MSNQQQPTSQTNDRYSEIKKFVNTIDAIGNDVINAIVSEQAISVIYSPELGMRIVADLGSNGSNKRIMFYSVDGTYPYSTWELSKVINLDMLPSALISIELGWDSQMLFVNYNRSGVCIGNKSSDPDTRWYNLSMTPDGVLNYSLRETFEGELDRNTQLFKELVEIVNSRQGDKYSMIMPHLSKYSPFGEYAMVSDRLTGDEKERLNYWLRSIRNYLERFRIAL